METAEATRVDAITSLEQRVAHLPDWDDLTKDDALKMLDDAEGIDRRLRTVTAALKAFLVVGMPARGWRELTLNTKRWWVGPKKRPPKCKNVAAALEAIMVETGGDYEAACNALSSNALKYGEARKILGEKFSDHFEQVTTDELLSEGDNAPVLNSIDERFIK